MGFEFGIFWRFPVGQGEFPLSQVFADGGLAGGACGEFPLESDRAQAGQFDALGPLYLILSTPEAARKEPVPAAFFLWKTGSCAGG